MLPGRIWGALHVAEVFRTSAMMACRGWAGCWYQIFSFSICQDFFEIRQGNRCMRLETGNPCVFSRRRRIVAERTDFGLLITLLMSVIWWMRVENMLETGTARSRIWRDLCLAAWFVPAWHLSLVGSVAVPRPFCLFGFQGKNGSWDAFEALYPLSCSLFEPFRHGWIRCDCKEILPCHLWICQDFGMEWGVPRLCHSSRRKCALGEAEPFSCLFGRFLVTLSWIFLFGMRFVLYPVSVLNKTLQKGIRRAGDEIATKIII